jgi:sulfatase maturation enzyme AslB (radical SAM superfamily)
MSTSKPYKFINDEIIRVQKGIVNNTCTRYIGNASSIISLFLRAYSNRHNDPLNSNFYKKYHFVVYDSNFKHIEIFKGLLEWDGNFDVNDRYDSSLFHAHFDKIKDRLKVSGEKFNWHKTFGVIGRHCFNNFKKAWDHYRSSKFTYINADIIYDTDKFVEAMNGLEYLGPNYTQFVQLSINPNNYPVKKYTNSINELLYYFWLRSFKNARSIVELADDENMLYENYAGKLYAKMNPTFCVLPWMHIQYKPTGQSKLCCRYDTVHDIKEYEAGIKGNLADYVPIRWDQRINLNSMEDSFFGEYWDQARSLTINNLPISGCHKCYKEEEAEEEVAVSMRLGSAILYNNGFLHKRPGNEIPKIKFLEVGFGNYCNLACLSCNSSLSTTWHDDEVKLNEISNDELKREINPKLDNLVFDPNDETLKTLNLIKFTGGEPMINPEFIKFIDLICERGHPENIKLEIYTNCSYVPSPKLLANLIRFKDIQLNLSIDAYGEINDYMRFGSKWSGDHKQTVLNSLNFWLQTGVENHNINVIMSTTLSILNIFEIPTLMDWWIDHFRNSGNKIVVHRTNDLPDDYSGFFKLQIAHDPKYLAVNILPREYYAELLEWVNGYEERFLAKYPEYEFLPESLSASLKKIKNIVSLCKGNLHHAKMFLSYLDRMDSIRGNSSAIIQPTIDKVKDYLNKNTR